MRNLYDNIIYPDKNIFLDETGYSRSVYFKTDQRLHYDMQAMQSF